MLDQERTAYMAFLDLKRAMSDWAEVASYAQKILVISEKIAVVKTITVTNQPMGLSDAQKVLRAEAEKIGKNPRAQKSVKAASEAGATA